VRGVPPHGVHPALQLVRIGNTIVSFAGTVVGGLAARGAGFALPGPVFVYLILAAFSTASVTAGGNVINDIFDRESDRINHPDRPLVTGAITPRQARAIAIGLLVASGALILPVVLSAPLLVPILAAAVTALLAYELRFKSAGFAGNLLVAFLTGAVFLYGGAAVGAALPVVPFALMAFFATLSREVIKDMEDVPGDVERRTLPRTLGIPLSGAVAKLSVATAIVLSAVPPLFLVSIQSISGLVYVAFVVAADALFVASVAWLPRHLHREQSVSKGAMAVALLAFLSVAFR
jgi:geranylgeranylglycerol-phosphate geranylgeranyltransferase